jgi:prepilin signal peptidase PulO-like enzyme (type II secretory pathway)
MESGENPCLFCIMELVGMFFGEAIVSLFKTKIWAAYVCFCVITFFGCLCVLFFFVSTFTPFSLLMVGITGQVNGTEVTSTSERLAYVSIGGAWLGINTLFWCLVCACCVGVIVFIIYKCNKSKTGPREDGQNQDRSENVENVSNI